MTAHKHEIIVTVEGHKYCSCGWSDVPIHDSEHDETEGLITHDEEE